MRYISPLEITRGSQLCLLSLRTNNSILNIEPKRCTVGFCNGLGENYTVSLPIGTYELKSLESCIIKQLPESVAFELRADENTLKRKMRCDDEIDFTVLTLLRDAVQPQPHPVTQAEEEE